MAIGPCGSFALLKRLRVLVSGEGLFVSQAQGRGVVFVQRLGAIVQRQLGPGEQWVGECDFVLKLRAKSHKCSQVDNGHLVAWTAQYKVERIQAGGLFSAAHTDEGLICRYVQRRSTVFARINIIA